MLESMQDECAQVITASGAAANLETLAAESSVDTGSDWQEVGHKQRPAITRSSGLQTLASPITKIFGGQLRSELRVPGRKDSVTLEPYQALQLDIGAPYVRNIVDALRGLTRQERLHGDFGSPRGKDLATKQVFVESLPPVLILHLKRFQFDAEGNGTVKIWKKVGYPLDLEIPHEILARSKKQAILADGPPKYRLSGVIYHHGKNASGGHYTVDVRRQDDLEWVRLDDTVIRRIGSEDVAEGGAEEAATPPSGGTHGNTTWASRRDGLAAVAAANAADNRFAVAGMGDDDASEEDGWKQVSSGGVNGGKRWSNIVNGNGGSAASAQGAASAGAVKGKPVKDNIKDNKVAYLLFYQRV